MAHGQTRAGSQQQPPRQGLPHSFVLLCASGCAWHALHVLPRKESSSASSSFCFLLMLCFQSPQPTTTPCCLLQVKLVRSPKRLGLIRARVLGAEHTSSDYMVFLDSHCEANLGWLEPLLEWMVEDKSRVVCPTIDRIRCCVVLCVVYAVCCVVCGVCCVLCVVLHCVKRRGLRTGESRRGWHQSKHFFPFLISCLGFTHMLLATCRNFAPSPPLF